MFMPMLIDKDDFLFPQTIDSLATGCVMGLCAQWPLLWENGCQNMLARIIAGRLSRVLNLALAAEQAEARAIGRFKAATPEGRYRQFDELLARQRLQDLLLDKYEGLSELPWTLVSDWTFEFDAMLRRLKTDGEDIAKCLGVSCDLDELKDIAADCADLHESGAGVCILEFRGGERLVYKPRSMAPDVLFSRLVSLLNAELGWEAYLAPATMDMGAYGWQECIAEDPCRDEEAVKLFFRRQGANLALLYLLGGVDFHAENMIACADFPIFVDLETVMQPVRDGTHLLERSGMVPVHGREYDYSALGCAPDPAKRVHGFVWCDWGRDTLHMKAGEVPCNGPYCLPQLAGRRVSVQGFEQEVVDAFSRTLQDLGRAFSANRDLVDTVVEMPIRYIHRPTQVYHGILTASLHPDNLESMEDRRHFIEARLCALGPQTPAGLLEHEASVIEEGYIPTCRTRADSCDLWYGSVREPGFFPQATITQLRQRVREAPTCNDRLCRSLISALCP